jgi:hypothetical protein
MFKKTINSPNPGKGKSNESGMILLIAATFIFLISVVVIGILSRNTTQFLSANKQYQRIQAEQLARGAWWILHDRLSKNLGVPAAPGPFTINGTTYTITYLDQGMVGGRHQYRVQVSY